jgi:aminoglycoside phosphotransferase
LTVVNDRHSCGFIEFEHFGVDFVYADVELAALVLCEGAAHDACEGWVGEHGAE